MSRQLPLSYEQMRSLVIQYLAQPTREPQQLSDLRSRTIRRSCWRHPSRSLPRAAVSPSPARRSSSDESTGSGVTVSPI